MSGNGRRNRPASTAVLPSSITSSNIKRRTRRSGSGQQRGRCRDDFHGHQVDDQRRVPVPHDGRQKRRARRAQRVGGFQSESCIIIVVPTPTLRWYKDDNEFVPKSVNRLRTRRDRPVWCWPTLAKNLPDVTPAGQWTTAGNASALMGKPIPQWGVVNLPRPSKMAAFPVSKGE